MSSTFGDYELVAKYADLVEDQINEMVGHRFVHSCSLLVSNDQSFYRHHGINEASQTEKKKDEPISKSLKDELYDYFGILFDPSFRFDNFIA